MAQGDILDTEYVGELKKKKLRRNLIIYVLGIRRVKMPRGWGAMNEDSRKRELGDSESELGLGVQQSALVSCLEP